MTQTTSTAAALAAAVAERTRLVAIAELSNGRTRRAAWAAVDAADQAVKFAAADHERAVRASMPDATEAQVQAASR